MNEDGYVHVIDGLLPHYSIIQTIIQTPPPINGINLTKTLQHLITYPNTLRPISIKDTRYISLI
jgi:hypothetical protein